jgi:hypothetical protein
MKASSKEWYCWADSMFHMTTSLLWGSIKTQRPRTRILRFTRPFRHPEIRERKLPLRSIDWIEDIPVI